MASKVPQNATQDAAQNAAQNEGQVDEPVNSFNSPAAALLRFRSLKVPSPVMLPSSSGVVSVEKFSLNSPDGEEQDECTNSFDNPAAAVKLMKRSDSSPVLVPADTKFKL